MRTAYSSLKQQWRSGAVLRLGVSAAMLLAASGPAYYYGWHLPEQERQLADARAEAELVRERAARIDALLLERQRLLTVGRYQRCLQAAGQAYEAEWARGCAWQAEQARRSYPACVARGVPKADCAAAIQPSPNCALLTASAEQITAHFERQRDRCLEELKAGIVD
jgi:hypothetical protein